MLENGNNKIEIFSAGCKFCRNLENEIKEIIGSNDTLIIYNLSEETKAKEYYKTAKMYGINSLPSVIVNGKLLNCCSSKGFNKNTLSSILN